MATEGLLTREERNAAIQANIDKVKQLPAKMQEQQRQGSIRGAEAANRKLPMEPKFVDFAVRDDPHLRAIGRNYVKAYVKRRPEVAGRRRKTHKSKGKSKKTKKRSRR